MSDSLRPMGCSTLGFPVLPSLPEFAQIHVHWVNDTIQPSHPLLSLLLLPSVFPSIRCFRSESALCIRWPKYWSFSFSISPSSEYLGLISLLNTYSMPDMVPITFYILTLNFHKDTMRWVLIKIPILLIQLTKAHQLILSESGGVWTQR